MLFLGVNCATLWPVISLVKNGIIPLIQIGIPIILIILGMLDLGKAVVASKEDEIKSAQKMLIKRCIYGIAIFFVVLLVTLVFGLVACGSNTDNAPADGGKTRCSGVRKPGILPDL